MRALPSLSLLLLVACFGPTPAQQAFVDDIGTAAEGAMTAAGASEAEARSIDAGRVAWITGEHTVVVDSVFPRKGATATVHLPVSVRFHQDEGSWVVDEAVPDRASMERLEKELGAAVVRSAQVRKKQAVIDRKVVRGQDAFTYAMHELRQSGQVRHVRDVSMSGCTGIIQVSPAWTAQPQSARNTQLEAMAGALRTAMDSHGVNCGVRKVRVVQGGETVGTWGGLTPDP